MDSSRLFGHEKSLCALVNNSRHVDRLVQTLRKATLMVRERAYLHHYEKFGIDKSKFEDTFLQCE